MIPERLLLGPGPSPVSPRVMGALSAPVLSHLDPALMEVLDDVQHRLKRVFGSGAGSFDLAISGTGTAGMEAAVANATRPGARALVVVNGYFGDRIAQMFERYGAAVTRVEGEWGRACDPAAVERALRDRPADIVALVHAETSTGVLNPVSDILALAAETGALTVVDAVTSLGGMPVRVADWGIDACYSCSQKGLGAPSGMAPLSFSARALERRATSRSFYLDLALLEDYWRRRRYHHTLSAPLIYALREALLIAEEEGLEARWARHERHHLALAAALEAIGLELLPPPGERLWTLNAVRVPDGVDEAAVRRGLLEQFNIEIGAGLGPLAGRIWRVGLMGSGSTLSNVLLFVSALESILRAGGHRAPAGNAVAAAVAAAR
ncbi:MAG TPA: alanine--glyoxylate aminotransferase family protein [Vicinamibacterales bacterium]|nr:alanine--glyoxylate aminotransferase family protein [Vicinamibacterales bacterium]